MNDDSGSLIYSGLGWAGAARRAKRVECGIEEVVQNKY